MSKVNAEIGQRVRDLRQQAGLTQERLGRLLGGLPRQAVHDREQGATRWSAEELVTLAHALGTDIGWFFGDAVEPDGLHYQLQSRIAELEGRVAKAMAALNGGTE